MYYNRVSCCFESGCKSSLYAAVKNVQVDTTHYCKSTALLVYLYCDETFVFGMSKKRFPKESRSGEVQKRKSFVKGVISFQKALQKCGD